MSNDRKRRDDEDVRHTQGVSRRGFIASVGSGAIAVAATAGLAGRATAAVQTAEPLKAGEMSKVSLLINGRQHKVLVEPRYSLLHVIREQLGLTGTKPGCERGECGACTVLIDGKPRYSCLTLAVEAEGTEIVTIEGLLKGEELGPVQQAFVQEDALQCGYCTPGQIIATEGLLRATPKPSLDQIREGLGGNICRCGAYVHIFKAVQRASEIRG